MVTIECPWCDGPAHVDGVAHTVVTCVTCGVVVEIALDLVHEMLEHAA